MPLMVFWAKHALVLSVFLLYLLQSKSFSLCLANSSPGISFIASAKDGHRISWSAYLSLRTCPPLPPVLSGVLSFPWVFAPFRVELDFSVSLHFPASFPLSLDPEEDGFVGWLYFGPASSCSSMMIPALITTDRRLFYLAGIVPYLLKMKSNMSLGIMLVITFL